MPDRSAPTSPEITSHAERFPGETPAYREARDRLLAAEIELRARLEEVSALRRALPLGGAVPQDYVFEEGVGDLDAMDEPRPVRLSELFTWPDASLVAYSLMYGPAMARPCPNCTSIVDALNATAPHATQRINLVVIFKSPLARIRELARRRGWRHLRLLSSAGNGYNRDYHGETERGEQVPCLNVFSRRGGAVHHTYATEMLFLPSPPGMDHRHVDLIWPLWNLLDFTSEGRGSDWYPGLDY